MNIVITGFMGTGKTSVGKIIAEKLGWEFYDVDRIIEEEVGSSIAEIFSKKGEDYFRKVEANAVRLLSILDESVISCGGGVVLSAKNMDELEMNGVVVCLLASPEKIVERTGRTRNRPLLNVEEPVKKIKELLNSRKKHYERCSLAVTTDDLTEEEVASIILKDPSIVSKLRA
jgi:shikimate kinase